MLPARNVSEVKLGTTGMIGLPGWQRVYQHVGIEDVESTVVQPPPTVRVETAPTQPFRPIFDPPGIATNVDELNRISQEAEAARRQPLPTPSNVTIQPGTPPYSITQGSVIYDGDYITLSSKAWSTSETGGGILLRRDGTVVGGSAFTSELQTSLREFSSRHGPFQFLIRKVERRGGTSHWNLANPNLTAPVASIGWREPFLLIATDVEDAVMRTDLVDRTAFARINEGKPVKFGPWPAISREDYEACRAGLLGTAKDTCVDSQGQAVALWYFERPASQFAVANPCYVRIGSNTTKNNDNYVLIRNYYGLAAGNNFYSGGRNLVLDSGSNGRRASLAVHNNDSDDKARWLIATYRGDNYPVQRYNYNDQGVLADQSHIEDTVLQHVIEQADPRNTWERIFYKVTGSDWAALTFYERLAYKISLGAVGALGTLVVVDEVVGKVLD